MGREGDWAIGRVGDWAIGRVGDRAIGRVGDRAKGSFVIYTLRYIFATHSLDNNVNLRYIQGVLGTGA